MGRRRRGSVVIFALATAWGFVSILVREVPLPALTLVFWRVFLGALAVGAVMLARGERGVFRAPGWATAALGLVLGVHWICYFAAIQHTSVASANLITYANPIVIAAFAPALLGERLTGVTLGALVASVAGIVLIAVFGPSSGSGAVHAGGLLLAGLAAVSYAAMILGMKRWSGREDPVRVVFWQAAVAAIALLPAAVPTLHHSLDARQWGYLVLLGFVLTGVSGLIFVSAIRWVPATSVGILAYMEPVSAALLAALLLGETLTWSIAVGGATIVAAGIAVIRLQEPEEAIAPTGPIPPG